jgi:GTPase Era involved in 16S rRNA processing
MTAAENFIRQADMLLENWPAGVRLPTVAVAGPYNAGKSTLINALLENYVAPVDVVPTTMVTVKYVYGPAVSGPARARRVREVALPCRLLQKCLLLDTPGFDTSPEHRAAAMEAAAGADLALFLLHQRGLDNAGKQFLEELARRRQINPRDIIFILNHNTGHPDDSAPGVTAACLRQIFKAGLQPLAIDITNPAAVNSLRTLLEVEAAARRIEELNRNLRTMDEAIPKALKTTLARPGDLEFLADLWDLKQRAASILQAGELLQSRAGARIAARRNLSGPAREGRLKYQPPAHPDQANKSLIQVRRSLLELLDRFCADPSMTGLPATGQADALRRRLEQGAFPVTIAGGFSSGKTTFINVMLGEEILPTGDGPTTSCPTRVRQGQVKQATLHYPLQIDVPVIHLDGEAALYCREEVKALTGWLGKPESGPELGRLELISQAGRKKVSKYQLLNQLHSAARLFAAGLAGQPGLNTAPTLFQAVPATRITADLPVAVQVTFREENTLTLSLDTAAGKLALVRHLAWPDSFRLSRVEITHPSELLSGLVLIDTPGLDSVHRRHRETTSSFITELIRPKTPASAGSWFQRAVTANIQRGLNPPLNEVSFNKEDRSVLFFLNARHVLNTADRDQLPALSRLIRQGPGGGSLQQSPARLMLVINFADTLSPREREKVRNYIRESLSPATLRADERLFFLSARRASANPRDKDFRHLIEAIRLAAGSQLAAPLAGVLKDLREALEQRPAGQKTTACLAELGRLERRLGEVKTTPGTPRR